MANQIQVTSSIFTGNVLKEDVVAVIFQITPTDTPLFNIMGDTRATNVKHEWLTRSLGSRSFQNVPEGDVFALSDFKDVNLPARVSNTCAIFRELPRVTETMAAVALHGIDDLMADQLKIGSQEYRFRIENAFWLSTETSGVPASGSDTTPRKLGGLITGTKPGIFSTNNIDHAGGTKLTEQDLNTILEDIWNAGGNPSDAFTGPRLRRVVNKFTATATKFMPHLNQHVLASVSVYENSFATLNFHLSRDIPGTVGQNDHDLVVIDRSFFRKAWLRPTFIEALPRAAGDTRMRIEGELTLEYGNEAAGGLIYDNLDPAAGDML